MDEENWKNGYKEIVKKELEKALCWIENPAQCLIKDCLGVSSLVFHKKGSAWIG